MAPPKAMKKLERLVFPVAKVEFVEEIPNSCKFEENCPIFPRVTEKLIELMQNAKSSIKIISYNFTLRNCDLDEGFLGRKPSCDRGERVFNEIEMSIKRGIQVRIVASKSSLDYHASQSCLNYLAEKYPLHIRVRYLDTKNEIHQLITGNCYAKLWIVDEKNLYLGTSNFTGMALSEAAQVGIVVTGSSQMGFDVGRIFDWIWDASAGIVISNYLCTSLPIIKVPESQPQKLTRYKYAPVISSSPELCSTVSMTPRDIEAVVDVIKSAQSTISLCSFHYSVEIVHLSMSIIYPMIFEAITNATERGIKVRVILDSLALDSQKGFRDIFALSQLPGVEVGVFRVEDHSEEGLSGPVSTWNVNMVVTDTKVWISSSSLTGYNFLHCSGVGITIDVNFAGPYKEDCEEILKNSAAYFNRYWNSQYVVKDLFNGEDGFHNFDSE